jgi:GTPase SAR1 family protein
MAIGAPLRAVFVGPENAGKTCLVRRLATDRFAGDQMTIPSLVSSFEPAVFGDGRAAVTVGLWDTPGQRTHRDLMLPPLRGADFVVLVFDLADARSFAGLRPYHERARAVAPPSAAFFVLGNKADIAAPRAVGRACAQDYADAVGAAGYLDVSAKTGDGLGAFREMVAAAAETGQRATEARRLEVAARAPAPCGC